ncbi:MAG: hypothetical protein ABIA92_03195 [Patescibacteria group bacterium]
MLLLLVGTAGEEARKDPRFAGLVVLVIVTSLAVVVTNLMSYFARETHRHSKRARQFRHHEQQEAHLLSAALMRKVLLILVAIALVLVVAMQLLSSYLGL